MSQKNVEVVQRMCDAWNQDDFSGWVAPGHPEMEWSSAILRQMEGADAVHRGRSELRRFWDEWHALWKLEIELVDTRDLGDTVLALARIRTTGTVSQVPVERSIGYVFQFEDGLVRSVRAYLTPSEALEAVGLSE